jgi:hypothetical protein
MAKPPPPPRPTAEQSGTTPVTPPSTITVEGTPPSGATSGSSAAPQVSREAAGETAVKQPTPAHEAPSDPAVAELKAELGKERERREGLEKQLARLDAMIQERLSRLPTTAQDGKGSPFALNAPAEASADEVLVVNVGAAPIYVPDVLMPNGKHLTLDPGVNKIPRLAWERTKRKKVIRAHLSAGAHPFSKHGLREAGSGDVAQLSDEQALLLVASTTDEDHLRQWMARETRPMIRDAGNRQMEILRHRHEQIAEQMATAQKAGEVKTSGGPRRG